MTQLDQIKQDLDALQERLNKAMAHSGDTIQLTRDQLKEIVIAVQKQTLEYIESEIEAELDDLTFEDYVELELCDREIQIDVNSSSLASDIQSNISGPPDATDEDIDNLLEKIKES